VIARTPFVIRAADTGGIAFEEGSFHIMGPCYLHGMMNSEIYTKIYESEFRYTQQGENPTLDILTDIMVLV